MHERLEKLLKLACVVFLALLVYRVGRVLVRPSPLAKVSFPQVPTLAPAQTNAPAAQKHKPPGNQKKGEPGPKPAESSLKNTNAVGVKASGANTNGAEHPPGPVSANGAKLNAQAASPGPTNSGAVQTGSRPGPTSIPPTMTPASMNRVAGATPRMPPGVTLPPGVSLPPGVAMHGPMTAMRGGPPMGMPMMMGGPGMGGPMQMPDLPPEIKTRVEEVVQSEILAPIMHPMPMGLLGILGDTVLFRAPNGQTGLLRKGEEMGGVKLLRIGINRALFEEAGQEKELTIFSGVGGESLLSKDKEKPHEPSRN